MQSVLDDDVRKILLERPHFELAAKNVFSIAIFVADWRCKWLGNSREELERPRASIWSEIFPDEVHYTSYWLLLLLLWVNVCCASTMYIILVPLCSLMNIIQIVTDDEVTIGNYFPEV